MRFSDPELYLGYTRHDRRRKLYIYGTRVYERHVAPESRKAIWLEAGGGAKIQGVPGFATQPELGFESDREAIRFAELLFRTRERMNDFLALDVFPHYTSEYAAPSFDTQPLKIWPSAPP